MGLAQNDGAFLRDRGFRIVSDLQRPLLQHWPNPEVIRLGNRYHCFADPPGYPTKPGDSHWMSRQLREAVSDGLGPPLRRGERDSRFPSEPAENGR